MTPAPGAQPGTYTIAIFAKSITNPNLATQGVIHVTVAAVQPGLTLAVQPDPVFSVPFDGAELPTAFQASIHNSGPAADTYKLSFANIPAGFILLDSGTSVTVPGGQTGILGLYLQPTGTQLPPPGTQLSFTVTATSISNPAITKTVTEKFTVPDIDAVTLSSDPPQVSTVPGVAGTAQLHADQCGQRAGDGIVLLPQARRGCRWAGCRRSSLAVGKSAAETVNLTPERTTPLNSTLQATLTATFGPSDSPLTQTLDIPVDVVVPGARRWPARRRPPGRSAIWRCPSG